MKDPSRMPQGGIEGLEKLIEACHEDGNVREPILEWLVWAHTFLVNRKTYHKKATLKTSLLRKMAETLLSPDELESINEEVEKKL